MIPDWNVPVLFRYDMVFSIFNFFFYEVNNRTLRNSNIDIEAAPLPRLGRIGNKSGNLHSRVGQFLPSTQNFRPVDLWPHQIHWSSFQEYISQSSFHSLIDAIFHLFAHLWFCPRRQSGVGYPLFRVEFTRKYELKIYRYFCVECTQIVEWNMKTRVYFHITFCSTAFSFVSRQHITSFKIIVRWMNVKSFYCGSNNRKGTAFSFSSVTIFYFFMPDRWLYSSLIVRVEHLICSLRNILFVGLTVPVILLFLWQDWCGKFATYSCTVIHLSFTTFKSVPQWNRRSRKLCVTGFIWGLSWQHWHVWLPLMENSWLSTKMQLV